MAEKSWTYSIRVLAAVLVMVLVPWGHSAATAGSSYNWPQFDEGDWSGTHSGSNSLESALSTSTVGSLTREFRVSLPSIADGEPAVLTGASTAGGAHDLLFLTTKDGHILALDAHSGATIWSKQYGSNGCASTDGDSCATTSSPAVDPSLQYVYTYGLDGHVHKLQVGTGTEVTGSGWPELATLKPSQEKSAPALSIAQTASGTFLYVGNGGYIGDQGDYQGHVTAINLATGGQTVFNTLCSNQAVHFTQGGSPDCAQTQSAVWARPGVVYDPDTQKIYFATGNGNYDPSSYDWGDTVLALHPDGAGSSTTAGYPVDSWTPTNYASLQAGDTDLGSTAPAVLPSAAVPASSTYKHLAVQSGKDGIIRLLNLDNLSGQGGAGHTGGELFSMALPIQQEVLSQPAVWVNPADNHIWIFVTNNGGLSALTLTVSNTGMPSLQTMWSHSMTNDDSLGSSPLVANGVLFDARNNLIEALNPVTGQQLWQDTSIGGIHWQSPVVANGMLYIADQNGQLTGYGLPASTTPTSTIAAEGTDQALHVDHGMGFSSLGGVLLAAPAVVSLSGGNHLYIATGSDHRLWERTDPQSWQLLAPGSYCLDNPGAYLSGSTLTVACQGSDHAVWYSTVTFPANGLPTVNSFNTLGGATHYGPALAPVAGTLTFFVTGTDNRIWYRTIGSSWQTLGGWCTGHLGAAANGSTTYLACHGSNGSLWYATNSGAGWSGFQSLGGQIIDGPGIAATASGPIFVVEGTDQSIWQNVVSSGGTPGGWQRVGGAIQNGAAATAG